MSGYKLHLRGYEDIFFWSAQVYLWKKVCYFWIGPLIGTQTFNSLSNTCPCEKPSVLRGGSILLMSAQVKKMKFQCPIYPIPFVRARSNGPRRFDDPRYTQFKKEVAYYAKEAMGRMKPFTCPVRAEVTIYKKRHDVWSRNWGDIDNFVKAIFDALNGIVFVDDSQVVEICAAKKCGENGIDVVITPLE